MNIHFPLTDNKLKEESIGRAKSEGDISESDTPFPLPARCISRAGSFACGIEPPVEDSTQPVPKVTVLFPGTIIARPFLKERSTEGLVSKALMVNADALCAPVSPVVDDVTNV